MIGIGVMVGIALLLTFLSYQKFDSKSFLIFLTFTSAYMVYAEMLELYVLIFSIIIMLVLVGMDLKERGRMR